LSGRKPEKSDLVRPYGDRNGVSVTGESDTEVGPGFRRVLVLTVKRGNEDRNDDTPASGDRNAR
jgi:hypothetical protein